MFFYAPKDSKQMKSVPYLLRLAHGSHCISPFLLLSVPANCATLICNDGMKLIRVCSPAFYKVFMKFYYYSSFVPCGSRFFYISEQIRCDIRIGSLYAPGVSLYFDISKTSLLLLVIRSPNHSNRNTEVFTFILNFIHSR